MRLEDYINEFAPNPDENDKSLRDYNDNASIAKNMRMQNGNRTTLYHYQKKNENEFKKRFVKTEDLRIDIGNADTDIITGKDQNELRNVIIPNSRDLNTSIRLHSQSKRHYKFIILDNDIWETLNTIINNKRKIIVNENMLDPRWKILRKKPKLQSSFLFDTSLLSNNDNKKSGKNIITEAGSKQVSQVI